MDDLLTAVTDPFVVAVTDYEDALSEKAELVWDLRGATGNFADRPTPETFTQMVVVSSKWMELDNRIANLKFKMESLRK
jgi:hypothetical protein